MKRIIYLSIVFFAEFNFTLAQGINAVYGPSDYDKYFFVGNLPYHSTGTREKLQVSVFGGDWHNLTLGEASYYISSRDGLKINREIHGGSCNKFMLEVYDNGTSYDFVIHLTHSYPAVQIFARKLHNDVSYGINNYTDVEITYYDITGKTNISSQVTIKDIFITRNDGNIGLGVYNPSEKLVVDGKIIAEEVKVQNVPSSDYVFEPDYNLLSLQEVETFIKENKHLPDIPSAEEFKENGVGLGEMDNMLLRKVEELVLYVIELKREKEQLKEMVLQQGKEIDTLKNKL